MLFLYATEITTKGTKFIRIVTVLIPHYAIILVIISTVQDDLLKLFFRHVVKNAVILALDVVVHELVEEEVEGEELVLIAVELD